MIFCGPVEAFLGSRALAGAESGLGFGARSGPAGTVRAFSSGPGLSGGGAGGCAKATDPPASAKAMAIVRAQKAQPRACLFSPWGFVPAMPLLLPPPWT